MLLPLLIFSAGATNISALGASFWLTARWALAAMLVAYAVAATRGIRHATGALLAVAAYVFWCLMTMVWSDLSLLTGAKVVGVALVTSAGLWGGHWWVMSHDRARPFGFLWVAVAMAAAAVFAGGTEATFAAGDLTLFAGATANPNFLGTLVPLGIPVVLWGVVAGRRHQRLLLAGMLAGLAAILYLTVSRGGYVIFVGTMSGLLISLQFRRFVAASTAALVMFIVVFAIAPESVEAWVIRNIYKAGDVELGVLSARERVWQESWVAAIEGGWTGAGVGVSVGGDVNTLGSAVTTMGYGREKGNSQLAVVEETGLIGLGFYALLMMTLFGTLARGFARARGDTRTQLGIVIGTMAGMIGQSILEAWWVGPGSTEYIFFWVFAGVGLALATPVTSQHRYRVRRLPATAGETQRP